jgi:hypothetical protein
VKEDIVIFLIWEDGNKGHLEKGSIILRLRNSGDVKTREGVLERPATQSVWENAKKVVEERKRV